MVICSLKGGLGNQMFQYAVAREFSRENSQIFFDLSFLKENNKSLGSFTAREFELHIFKEIQFKFLNPFILKLYLSNKFVFKIFRSILNLKKAYIINDDTDYSRKDQDIVYLNGYFQNPLLFGHIRTELLKDFSFPELPENVVDIADLINTKNAISIHVRRGDYLKPENDNYHGVLPISYYKSAIDRMIELNKDVSFFIFSDDSEWCKLNFSFIEKEKYFISDHGNPSWVDLKLMTLCKHAIIANSSFSWWGAWLNDYNEKIVIAPKNWYKNEISKIIPKEWMML